MVWVGPLTPAVLMSCFTTWAFRGLINGSDLHLWIVAGLGSELANNLKPTVATGCPHGARHNSDEEKLKESRKPTDPWAHAQTNTHTSPFLLAASCYGIPTIAGIHPLLPSHSPCSTSFCSPTSWSPSMSLSLTLLSTYSLFLSFSPDRVQDKFTLLVPTETLRLFFNIFCYVSFSVHCCLKWLSILPTTI